MTYKIGIFNTENEAVAAIQALEQAGFTNHELKVLAKDREHSRQIESETNVHADEMTDLLLTRAAADDHGVDDLRIYAPMSAASGLNISGGFIGGMTYPSNGFLISTAFLGDERNMENALTDIGLESSDAEPCREALRQGAIIVAADIGNSDEADGPDLSRGGAAEAAFRSCGAARIL
ncbi:general stress protein [Paenibacillus lignilyticus]|uniref:General stress protein n=1 Tax=Paenibacillus lignilyticus TaxID=1172615 RepID=A0ABS5CL80_9BACL|nr:general stress protein [Paenibacillus lignilyticus]MBP3966619.1 general stress protein [Paenibacillus lignilyticus]